MRSSIQSAKTRPGADCGSDHELLITKFRLQKVGITPRPFRYDLNQIPYDQYRGRDNYKLREFQEKYKWQGTSFSCCGLLIKVNCKSNYKA